MRWQRFAVLMVSLIALPLLAEEPAKEAAPKQAAPKQAAPSKAAPTQEELIKKLAADLTNVKFVGSFTVTGKEADVPKEEEYTITSALKLPEPDLWLLKTRVKYGKTDTTLPIPLEIKWAGDTPVITLTNLEIPGLGTFTSRVVIYEGRYAGTWQHGDVGGHLFGRIEKLPAEEQPAPQSDKSQPGKGK